MTKVIKDVAAAKERILAHINQGNRVVNSASIIDCSQGALKKAVTDKALEALLADGILCKREVGKNAVVYWRNQSTLNVPQSTSISELVSRPSELNAALKEKQDKYQSLKAELEEVTREPADSDLGLVSEEYAMKATLLTSELASVRSENASVSKSEMDAALMKLSSVMKKYSRQRRTLEDARDKVCEILNVRRSELEVACPLLMGFTPVEIPKDLEKFMANRALKPAICAPCGSSKGSPPNDGAAPGFIRPLLRRRQAFNVPMGQSAPTVPLQPPIIAKRSSIMCAVAAGTPDDAPSRTFEVAPAIRKRALANSSATARSDPKTRSGATAAHVTDSVAEGASVGNGTRNIGSKKRSASQSAVATAARRKSGDIVSVRKQLRVVQSSTSGGEERDGVIIAAPSAKRVRTKAAAAPKECGNVARSATSRDLVSLVDDDGTTFPHIDASVVQVASTVVVNADIHPKIVSRCWKPGAKKIAQCALDVRLVPMQSSTTSSRHPDATTTAGCFPLSLWPPPAVEAVRGDGVIVVTIGRHGLIHVDSATKPGYISRVHLGLEASKTGWFVTNFGVHGAAVNGIELKKPRRLLKQGDILTLAASDLVYTVEFSAEPDVSAVGAIALAPKITAGTECYDGIKQLMKEPPE